MYIYMNLHRQYKEGNKKKLFNKNKIRKCKRIKYKKQKEA